MHKGKRAFYRRAGRRPARNPSVPLRRIMAHASQAGIALLLTPFAALIVC
jgi:hypothetical protein